MHKINVYRCVSAALNWYCALNAATERKMIVFSIFPFFFVFIFFAFFFSCSELYDVHRCKCPIEWIAALPHFDISDERSKTVFCCQWDRRWWFDAKHRTYLNLSTQCTSAETMMYEIFLQLLTATESNKLAIKMTLHTAAQMCTEYRLRNEMKWEKIKIYYYYMCVLLCSASATMRHIQSLSLSLSDPMSSFAFSRYAVRASAYCAVKCERRGTDFWRMHQLHLWLCSAGALAHIRSDSITAFAPSNTETFI